MTQRFPHDFWSGRNLETKPDYRWDASRPRGLGRLAPYGFSRTDDWETLAPAEPEDELLQHFIDETALDEFDLDDEPIDESAQACLVEDLHPAGARAGLFIPEKYEPNYPYPVILWFHDAGGDESEWLSLMPGVSERNYFGLSLQGTVPNTRGGGWDWPSEAQGLSRLEKQIFQTVCELRRTFHIHSERVFLAGAGTGAGVALRLLLNRAEWFAGVFALGGELPALDPKSSCHPELRERRVFHTMPPSEADAEARQQNLQLWRAAGLNLMTDVDDNANQATPLRLQQLNHWVMESICAPV